MNSVHEPCPNSDLKTVPSCRRPSAVSWACALQGMAVSWPASRHNAQPPSHLGHNTLCVLRYKRPAFKPASVTIHPSVLRYKPCLFQPFKQPLSRYKICIVIQPSSQPSLLSCIQTKPTSSPVTIHLVYCDTNSPAIKHSPVTIHSLYRDLHLGQLHSSCNTISCITI